MKDSSIDIKFV